MDKLINLEKTLTFIKPQAITDGHLFAIKQDILARGIVILKERYCYLTKEGVEYHYRDLKSQPFFAGLVDSLTGKPIYAMELQGEAVIARFRDIIGPTDPQKCLTNQLRYKYGSDVRNNALHASDSQKSYESEFECFFTDNDFVKTVTNVTEKTLVISEAVKNQEVIKVFKEHGMLLVEQKSQSIWSDEVRKFTGSEKVETFGVENFSFFIFEGYLALYEAKEVTKEFCDLVLYSSYSEKEYKEGKKLFF